VREPKAGKLEDNKIYLKDYKEKYYFITLTYFKRLSIVLASPAPLYLAVWILSSSTGRNLTWAASFAAVAIWVLYALSVYFRASAIVYGLLALLRHTNQDRGGNNGKVIFTKVFFVLTQVLGVGILAMLIRPSTSQVALLAGLMVAFTQSLSFKYVPQLASSLNAEAK
jgi:hypothetical protein